MQDDKEIIQVFTTEMIDRMAQIWARASISLIDVRYVRIASDQPLDAYPMPTSVLAYIYGGAATIYLDQTAFEMERFGVFHGGKGTTLRIMPGKDQIGVYLVLYKPEAPMFFNKELQHMLEMINPFTLRFGCLPDNPLRHLDGMQQMLESWQTGTPLDRLHSKNLLYQSIRDIYHDLQRQKSAFYQPDPVMMAKRYLDEQYRKPLLFQDLADRFGISRGQLTRLFKKSMGVSLQEYLTDKRLAAARTQLLHTNATIKEIASGCGMVEELNLIRLFKKHYKMTPTEYRNKVISGMHAYDIDNNSQRLYNERGLTETANFPRDGAFHMFGQKRSKEAILAAALSMMLLLSACASGNPASSNNNSMPTPAANAAQSETAKGNNESAAQTATTRVIKTEQGEIHVPLHPERIVVQYLTGDLVAFDVVPVGITNVHQGAAYEEEVSASEVLGQWDFDLEDIMSLEPDLILLASDTQYDDLSKIAPAVVVPYGSMTTSERLAFIGEVLGKPEAVDSVVAAYESTIVEAREKLDAASLTGAIVSTMQATEDGIFVSGDKHAIGALLYHDFAFQAPEGVQTKIIDPGEYWGTISMEVLQDYAGDYMIHMGDVPEAITNHEVWKAIPAVANGRVVEMPTSLTYYSDVLSSIATIEYLVNALVE